MLLFTSYNSAFPNHGYAYATLLKDACDDNYEDHLGTGCDLYTVPEDKLLPLIKLLEDEIDSQLTSDIGGDDEFFDYFPDKLHVYFQLLYHFINVPWPNGKLNKQLYQHCLNYYQTAILAYDIREGNDLYHNDELCASNNCFFPDYEETENYIKSLKQ